jgi:hypothetical protein
MRPAEARLGLLLVVAAAAASAAALARGGATAQALPPPADGPAAWDALLGARPRVDLGSRAIVVLRTPSLAQGGNATSELAAQDRVAAAAGIRPELRFTRALNGFSAHIDAGLVPLVERDPDVAGVYPVRAAYPAYARTGAAGAASVLPPPGGLDGRGVRVALLARPGGAQLLADALAHVAPGAEAIPVPVGPRSDEVLAGIERAVALHARLAVVAVSEPYAGFPDSPETRAAAGAAALGTLVVAAAGDDGFAAGRGDLSAWAAAPSALAVAAADTRPTTTLVRVALRGWSGTLPLAGGTAPARRLELRLATPSGRGPLAFFAPSGASLAAGRAALVDSLAGAAHALRAGAAALLVEGRALPAGGLAAPVPVVALPAGAARGGTITLAPAGTARNRGGGRLASFSSTGPGAMLAAGVGVPTSGAATLSGTGAAAAVAAGRVAIEAEAEPSLTAAQLRARFAASPRRGGPSPRVAPLGGIRLGPRTFAAADTAPALLTVDAGRVVATTAGPEIVSLARLDVELWQGARRLGTLARLRDVLPGRYTFGLTGRSPAGGPLPSGEYALKVVAYPLEGGSASRRIVRFSLR